MAAPHTPNTRQGASKHTGDVTRRYEGPIPGGRAVEPHVQRSENWKHRKIKRMQEEARTTEKIG